MAAIFRRVRKVFVRIFRRDRKRTFSINESSTSAIKRRFSGATATTTNNQNEIDFENHQDNCLPEWRYNPRIDFDLGSSEESIESENFVDDYTSENFCRQNLTFDRRHHDEEEENFNEEISIIDIQR